MESVRADQAGKPAPDRVVVVESGRLMAGGHEIHIRHEGQIYRLRITKNGKLILTK